MIGQDFERNIVKSFNLYASTYDKHLVAYRHIQIRYQPQLFDILVDSRFNEFYLALECKSIDVSTVDHLYFKKAFSWKNGVCQIQRENDWLTLSGRNGFLVVELRRPRPGRVHCYFVPWHSVHHAFVSGSSCIDQSQVTNSPSCIRSGGKYIFDDSFIEELINVLPSYPKSRSKAYRHNWRSKSQSTQTGV